VGIINQQDSPAFLYSPPRSQNMDEALQDNLRLCHAILRRFEAAIGPHHNSAPKIMHVLASDTALVMER
jgi:hypothetical protein